MDELYMRMAERLAALEAKAEHADEQRDEMTKTLSDIRTTLSALNAKISRWEGKFGGVMFIVGCLWAFFIGVPGAIMDWLRTFGSIGK